MKPRKTGGYSYTITKAKIQEYRALPVEMRLEWLEEANRFLWEAMTGRTKKIREDIRKGRL